jgi:RNA polymerase sigma factor (sigma-70 family)
VSTDDPYRENQDLIEDVLRLCCRRNRLPRVDAEDFTSTARLALLESNQARLRAFGGRSSFRTFLSVTIGRLLNDWCDANWGRWEPSAEAARQGHVAMRLEELVIRDNLPLAEAIETLRTNHGIQATVVELERLFERLPVRSRRRFVSDSGLEGISADRGNPEQVVNQARAIADGDRATKALDAAVRSLSAADKLILRMRFEDGMSIANIARLVGAEQKGLYRRIDRTLTELRRQLEAAGIGEEAAASILAHQGMKTDDSENPLGRRLFNSNESPLKPESAS